MIKKIKQALLHRRMKKHLRFVQSMVQMDCFAKYLENSIFFYGKAMMIEISRTEDILSVIINLQETHHIVFSVDYKVVLPNSIEIIEVREYIPGEWEEKLYHMKSAWEYYSK